MPLVDKNTIKRRHDVNINPEHGRTIADAYDKLEHKPNDPAVKEAYTAFQNETKEQFDDIMKSGIKIKKLGPNDKGYSTAQEMHEDIIKNRSLKYFPTEQGFGTGSSQDHPMLTGSGIIDSEGKEMPHNDLFRIVHDINGHNLGDMSDFSAEGEHAAFLTHRQQYTPIAQKALFTETAGQANWGAFNRRSGMDNLKKITAGKFNELEFAEQKAGLLPDEIINGRWHE